MSFGGHSVPSCHVSAGSMCAGSLSLDLQKMAALCDVMKCCRGLPLFSSLFFRKIKNAYAFVCAPLSDGACVCPTVRLCLCVPYCQMVRVCPHCQIVRVCAPLSDCACVCPTVRFETVRHVSIKCITTVVQLEDTRSSEVGGNSRAK